MKALSLRQPWAHAVIYGGKRIENRVKWTNSHFRGTFLIHAAKGMTQAEYKDAITFARVSGVTEREWLPPPSQALLRGGIVGVADVIGIVRPQAGHIDRVLIQPFAGHEDDFLVRGLRRDEERWWMGAFALVLDDVRETPFVPCKGALGWFTVPNDVVSKALG